jgi:hypothetical protein
MSDTLQFVVVVRTVACSPTLSLMHHDDKLKRVEHLLDLCQLESLTLHGVKEIHAKLHDPSPFSN